MAPDKQTLQELRIHRPTPSAPRRFRGGWVALVCLAVIVAAVVWWWWRRPPVIEVRTVAAQLPATSGARTLLNASGYVTARRQATVSSQVTGRVLEVLVEEGAVVEEGEVLARIDGDLSRANLRLAEARVVSARKSLGETEANLRQAERTLERMKSLAEVHGISASDLDQALADANALRARLDRQQADVAVAEREVGVWKQQLDQTIIRAPFAGVVTSKDAQPGEMVSPMSAGGSFTRTGICTIVDMSSLEIEVDVNESYINRVKPGQPVVATLDSYPEWHIPAHVIAIIPTADRQKSTVRVRIAFDELDPRILPDMSLKVAFQSASESGEEGAPAPRGVLVPRAAIHESDGRDVVWVVRDERAELRPVTLGDWSGEQAGVLSGLSAGERVVVAGTEDLAPGARIREQSP